MPCSAEMLPRCARTSAKIAWSASCVLAKNASLRHGVGLHHVDVQVAVADVAEEADLPARVALAKSASSSAQNGSSARDRQRDVVLVRQAGGRQALADRLRGAPRARRPALRVLRERAVGRRARARRAPRPTPRAPRASASLRLDEHVVRRSLGERRRAACGGACTRARHSVGEELVGREHERRAPRLAEERAARRRGRAPRRASRRASGQARELQRRLGDDAERALAADEELAQVDARVVLLERAVRARAPRRSRARPRGRAPSCA